MRASNDPKKKEKLEKEEKSLAKLQKKFDKLQVQMDLCDEIANAKLTLTRTKTDCTRKTLTQKIEYLQQQLKERKPKKDDKKAAGKKGDKVSGKKDDGKSKKSGKM